MKTYIRSLVSVLLLSGVSLLNAAEPAKPAAPAAPAPAPAAKPEPRLFGGMVADAVHVKATVEAINYETRVVTLKTEQGEVRTITAGPEVKRLAEIKVGDTIEAVYAEAVTVLAGDSAGAPKRDDSVQVERASKEEKPGGAMLMTTRVLGTVTALDFKARTATLKGPNRTVTINVPAEAVNFEKMKVGDSVYLEFNQALAVAVTKSAPAAK
jgi:hypothetical protein